MLLKHKTTVEEIKGSCKNSSMYGARNFTSYWNNPKGSKTFTHECKCTHTHTHTHTH